MLPALARILLLILLATGAAKGEEWSRYEAPGVAIDLPISRFKVTGRQPQRLTLSDHNNALLEVMAGDMQGMSTSRFRDLVENADPGRVITYRAGGRRWFVLSGYLPDDDQSGQMIYYAKFVIAPGGDAFAGFEIIYPRGRKASFDKIVSRLQSSLEAL